MKYFPFFCHQTIFFFIGKIQGQLYFFIRIDIRNTVYKITSCDRAHRVAMRVQKRLSLAINADIIDSLYLCKGLCQRRPAQNLPRRFHIHIFLIKIQRQHVIVPVNIQEFNLIA